MNIKQFARSKKFTLVMLVLGALVILLAVFQAGISVGFHRAGFSYHMGEDYYRAFGDAPRGPGIGMMGDRGFPNAHGAIGRIIKLSLPTITVLGTDNIEKVITTDQSTEVRRLRDEASASELALDEYIVVIGTPNEHGEIVARLIRILPPPPEFTRPNQSINATESTSPLAPPLPFKPNP